MEEITFQVQRDEQSGWLVASWDDPNGAGGITTQGEDLRDLQQQITDAVAVHFDDPGGGGDAHLVEAVLGAYDQRSIHAEHRQGARHRVDVARVRDADELPPPEELATDAISELEGAVEELNGVLALLENRNGIPLESKAGVHGE